MEFFHQVNVDWLGKKWYFLAFSLIFSVAGVISMTIDEVGMARTADRKAEVCRRIFDICVGEYGLAPDSLIFDVITFPVTTGRCKTS